MRTAPVDVQVQASPGSPGPPEGHPPRRGRLVVITVTVLAAVAAAATGAALGSRKQVPEPVASNQTTTSAAAPTTSEPPTTTTASTNTTEAVGTTTEPIPTTTLATIETEPAGLFCRDLAAKGYRYEAVQYWIREGEPSRMDASGKGVPCQTVYSRAEVERRWGADAPGMCPNASELEAALYRNSDLAGAIVPGEGLTDIECAGSWVRALTMPPPGWDAIAVFFRIDNGKPTAVDAGSAIFCEDLGVFPGDPAYGGLCQSGD